MIRVKLSEDDTGRLERTFAAATDVKFRARLQIVLMAHRGRPYREIATDVGVSGRTVTRWLNTYCDGGLPALMPRKAKGAAAKVPAALADEVKQRVAGGPAGQGLARANRTYAELADHLRKVKGVKASRSAVVRFCRKLGVRVYRPTYRLLRGDAAKQAAAGDELRDLKKRPRRANSCCRAGTRRVSRWCRR